MNLYLISRVDDWIYDDFDAFVVAAKDELSAIKFTPRGDKFDEQEVYSYYRGWASKENLKIECIGESNSPVEKVIIASFNAG